MDRLRLALLRAGRPWSGRIAADREARVAIAATVTVVGSWLLASTVPLALLALGPILLGVPHLLADVRYCIVRAGLHRDRALRLALLPIVAVALGAHMTVGLAAVGVVVIGCRASRSRRAIGLAIVVALIVIADLVGQWFDVALIHVHNVVAVALWLAWRRRQRRLHLVPLALMGLGSLAIVLWPAPFGLELFAPASVGMPHHFAVLAPELAPPTALRVVLLFAFMQSVHYGLWLRVIPEEDRERPTPRSFTASLRALDRELGSWLVRIAILLTAGLAVWAAFDLFAARIGYLRFARFHAVLEFCVAALVLTENRTVTARQE